MAILFFDSWQRDSTGVDLNRKWRLGFIACLRPVAFVCITVSTGLTVASADPLPWANPWDVGLDYEYVNRAYSDMQSAISDGAAPGAVGLILKDGKIVARRAVGAMQTHDIRRATNDAPVEYSRFSTPMDEQALFDLASVTKMISTTTAIMVLVERGEIDLDSTVAHYIPSFAGRAKDQVTVRQLLTHSSGLPAWRMFYHYCTGREEVYRSIDEDVHLEYKPGDKRIYSDIGFITLGRLVETLSGVNLDEFTRREIFEPLGMKDTGYTPRPSERLRVPPTEYDAFRNQPVRGIVHDENTRVMGGVSGHAGLFSTANDLAIYAQMLLDGGEFNGVRVLKPETIELMTTPQLNEDSRARGTGFLRRREQLLGWWGMDENAALDGMGGLPSRTAFGHSGFTGTMIWIAPEYNMAGIMLSNAVHPRREDATRGALYRSFFHNIARSLLGPNQVNILSEGN